jgi:hypothetical protein
MTYEQTPAPEIKKRRGCFFYGCLTTLVIVILVCVFAVFAVRSLVRSLTDTSPMPFPTMEMAAADYEALKTRVGAFREAVDKQKGVAPLALTSDEINALIARGTNTAMLKDKIYVTIEGDKIAGKVSIPLADSHVPFARGRYLNGTASFKASLQNGVLIVTVDSVFVKNKPLWEAFMAGLRNQNLAKDIYSDPKSAETLRKIDTLEVKEDKIVIKPRASP